jgi:dTDP-4-amino-4,6-dideoxygalactose transaminase
MGIHYLADKYNLKREDEVCIFTTFDKNYVSSCVTSTFFNYCKVSRVISKKTKMIFIIHEFGVPNPRTIELVKLGKQKKIPVVEDNAQGINSFLIQKRIGNFGDYSLYSLPKHLPMQLGGILVGNNLSKDNEWYDNSLAADLEKQFYSYLPYLYSLSLKRKELFQTIRSSLQYVRVVFEYNNNYTPYFVIFKTPLYAKLYETLSEIGIEWGQTYVKNWFSVPLQPLMTHKQLTFLIQILKKNVKN